MTAETIPQLEELWEHAGGSPKEAAVMAGLANQQSGGDPSAVNPNDPYGGSFGLWQINGGNFAFLRQHGIDPGELSNPAVNAKAAELLANGGSDLGPWSTVDAPGGGTELNPVVAAFDEGDNVFAIGPGPWGTNSWGPYFKGPVPAKTAKAYGSGGKGSVPSKTAGGTPTPATLTGTDCPLWEELLGICAIRSAVGAANSAGSIFDPATWWKLFLTGSGVLASIGLMVAGLYGFARPAVDKMTSSVAQAAAPIAAVAA